MNHQEKLAQDYIDAIADPQCRCEGRLFSFKMVTGPVTLAPDCAARHNCRMFDRSVSMRKPMRLWRATAYSDVCEGRRAWEAEQQAEQRREELDAMEWIITIGDREWQASKTTAQMALMLCLVQLRREGMPDEEVRNILDNKLYQIRER